MGLSLTKEVEAADISSSVYLSSPRTLDAKWESLWAHELVTDVRTAGGPNNTDSQKRGGFLINRAQPSAKGKGETKGFEGIEEMKDRSEVRRLGWNTSDPGFLEADEDFTSSFNGKRARPRSLGACLSLKDADFEELKGCIDLGFAFDGSVNNPSLCQTLPALRVYYAVVACANSLEVCPDESSSWGGDDSLECLTEAAACSLSPRSPLWRVSSPGDDPKEVKERLRHWAQAVGCNARLGICGAS